MIPYLIHRPMIRCHIHKLLILHLMHRPMIRYHIHKLIILHLIHRPMIRYHIHKLMIPYCNLCLSLSVPSTCPTHLSFLITFVKSITLQAARRALLFTLLSVPSVMCEYCIEIYLTIRLS